METFCPMLSILEILWPETFWAETFWADTYLESWFQHDQECHSCAISSQISSHVLQQTRTHKWRSPNDAYIFNVFSCLQAPLPESPHCCHLRIRSTPPKDSERPFQKNIKEIWRYRYVHRLNKGSWLWKFYDFLLSDLILEKVYWWNVNKEPLWICM